MKAWHVVRVVRPCGRCGKPIEARTPHLVIEVRGVNRSRVRCQACAGEPVGDVVIGGPITGTQRAIGMTRVGTIAEGLEWLERLRASAPETQPDCVNCEDTGVVVLVEQDGIRRAHPCQCRQIAAHPVAEGVPLEFFDATLASYRETTGNRFAVAAARAWLDADDDLYLFGSIGTGKSRLGASLLNDYHQKHRRGLFVRVPQLLLDLQLAFRQRTTDAEGAIWQQLRDEPLLVLDDVGVEKDSDFTWRTLYVLYEARGDRGHRTIWTSNLHPDQLGADCARISSRINGRAQVVELTGPDWRLVRAAENRQAIVAFTKKPSARGPLGA